MGSGALCGGGVGRPHLGLRYLHPPMKRTPLRRTRLKLSPKGLARRRMDKELDGLCRTWIVKLRDKDTCQRCKKTAAQSKIDWAHILSRAAKSARWAEWNSLALCAGCHQWWHRFPTEGVKWFAATFPERQIALEAWRHQRRHPKVDHMLLSKYFKQQIERW